MTLQDYRKQTRFNKRFAFKTTKDLRSFEKCDLDNLPKNVDKRFGYYMVLGDGSDTFFVNENFETLPMPFGLTEFTGGFHFNSSGRAVVCSELGWMVINTTGRCIRKLPYKTVRQLTEKYYVCDEQFLIDTNGFGIKQGHEFLFQTVANYGQDAVNKIIDNYFKVIYANRLERYVMEKLT